MAQSRYIRRDARNTGVIVFVHGLLGDSKTTWTNGRTGAYWPDLLTKDATFNGFDVYVYEYPTPIISTSYSPDEVTEDMRRFFDNDNVSKHHSIVFLSHSLGGIVTRAFLLKYRQVAQRVKFIYFFSTPTTGSDMARLGALFSKNPQFNKVGPMTSDSYLADLQRQWFAANFLFPSYCAYEKQSTFGQLIVEQQSATNLCNQRLDPIDANHIDIVKPESARSASYLAFRSAFGEVISQAVSEARPRRQVARSGGGAGGNGGSSKKIVASENAVGSIIVQPGGAASVGQKGGITVGQVNINTEPVNNPVVPEISITTQRGLTLSDFPELSISTDMLQHLRRHVLTVRNPNAIPLADFVMRFQFPEPIVESLMIEDRPAGVDIAWHACRVPFALTGIGEGASAEPTADGGTRITTAAKAGSGGFLSGNGEVCSAAMDNKKLQHTSIYQLKIEPLPAVTEVRLAFLTSDGPEESRYFEMNADHGDSESGLDYYGDGHYQYSSGGHIETRDMFLPLQFDHGLRRISSSPSSGEHGKWKIKRLFMNEATPPEIGRPSWRASLYLR